MRDPVALLDRLQAEPAAFDFYAALRLLECAYPELPRIGEAARPRDEAVRFGQKPSLAFEPAMLAGVQRQTPATAEGSDPSGSDPAAPRLGGEARAATPIPGTPLPGADASAAGSGVTAPPLGRASFASSRSGNAAIPAGSAGAAPRLGADVPAPRLLVNFFGLLGANGPMPVHLTEYIRDRLRNLNDPTLARFLDMFQHRMISLLYRAWSSAQPAVSLDRPGADRFAGYLGSLIGIGMPTLRDRDAVPDFAKLHYAGRLARHGGGAAGLEAILTDFFQVPVQVQQFVGHWMRLPSDGMFRLRSGPDAGALGQDTVLGKQVWNAQHKFRLLIGPLDMEQARELMPNAQGMRRLTAWVRQYAGLTQEWDVRLIIKKQSLPGLALGKTAQLGWTSWLSSKTPEHDDSQLCLTPPRPSHQSTEGAVHG